ncbi:MAG: hypothetical protein RR531_03415 [Longicatena sp.]
MTLLITIFAAIISTTLWYKKAPCDDMKISTLCFLYWGASLMWLVDAVFEFVELKAAYFTPDMSSILNDTFLGISVVAFGLLIWMINLLVKDPQGKIKSVLSHR